LNSRRPFPFSPSDIQIELCAKVPCEDGSLLVTFINDILVATDTEEKHNELVEEVLKRLEENNLFVKPEKCKWKVREIEFLGVVTGPREIEMQKEKVEEVLN